MARTVRGRITDSNTGSPVSGALVDAYDSDTWPDEDDHMGCGYTNNNGEYAIQYASGHWDPAPHNITSWRPDIYIKVRMCTQGGWVTVGESSVRNNRPHRHDTTINLSVNVPNPHARTVWGRITFEDDGTAAAGLTVHAYDDDVNNPFTQDPSRLNPVGRPSGLHPYLHADPEDDFMGATTTDNDGNYLIPYSAGYWDPSPFHGWTHWRPDIFIMVHGRAPESRWWQTLGVSAVHENVRHRQGVRIDLEVRRPVVVQEYATTVSAMERRLEAAVMEGSMTADEARAERAREVWRLFESRDAPVEEPRRARRETPEPA